VTFGVTVAVDLVTAVCIGVGVAALLALRATARSAHLDLVPLEPGDHGDEEHELLAEHIVAYRLDGPLFFAAAHRMLLDLPDIARVRIVILRMSRVSTTDSTGAHVLGDAIDRLERRGIVVLMSGIDPRHAEVLARLGISQHLVRDGLVLPDTPGAITRARELLAAPPRGKSSP
jgi:SulP family sulfate permease